VLLCDELLPNKLLPDQRLPVELRLQFVLPPAALLLVGVLRAHRLLRCRSLLRTGRHESADTDATACANHQIAATTEP
jgi:hypothetical protein